MGDKITLNLDLRTLQGKKVKQLRKDGLVPAVVYGPGFEPVNVQAAQNVMDKVIREAGKHAAVHLTIDNKKEIAMIKDVETDPVKGGTLHVSFHAVKQDTLVVAEVPIHLVGKGESEAEKAGLIILQSIDYVEVRALPLNLPDSLEISVMNLSEAGQQLTLGDITLPKDVTFVEHTTTRRDEDEEVRAFTDLVIASVYEPAALEAANDAAAGEAEIDAEVESENGSAEVPTEGQPSTEAKK
jgi:large subunit ribosomal protein L25